MRYLYNTAPEIIMFCPDDTGYWDARMVCDTKLVVSAATIDTRHVTLDDYIKFSQGTASP